MQSSDRSMREGIPFDTAYIQGIQATYTVPVYARRVDAATVSGGSAFTVTMFDPSFSPGAIVTVFMTARNGTKDITVSGIGFSDITLAAANEFTVLYSDGVGWHEIASNHA